MQQHSARAVSKFGLQKSVSQEPRKNLKRRTASGHDIERLVSEPLQVPGKNRHIEMNVSSVRSDARDEDDEQMLEETKEIRLELLANQNHRAR